MTRRAAAIRSVAIRRHRSVGVAGIVAAALIAGCSTTNTSHGGNTTVDRSNCTHIPAAVSSEKVDLLKALAADFSRSWSGSGCVTIDVTSKSSGGMATSLSRTWNEQSEGMATPVIWSPAASTWGAILNAKLTAQGQPALVTDKPVSLMVTPLVVAMPKPMADALGYPKTPVGWAQLLALAKDPKGWASKGHPEWGPFKLGKTNPNFSTSGLAALVAQNYAAVHKTSGLTLEDLDSAATVAFNRGIESSVVHYGDITMTFLNNWYRADQRGTSLTYASAVAIEEKSVIDYNQGNPDGVLAQGEVPRKPKVPLVAIYPTEGTLFSDNPLYVLKGDWVGPDRADIAKKFIEFVQMPENQRKVLKYGFRPGNSAVQLGVPITAANGVDPDQPQTTLQVPSPQVLTGVLSRWDNNRKGARVMLVIDVSGSMGEPAASGSDQTKLELAQRAAINALDQFKDNDLVAVRTFTTDSDGKPVFQDLSKMAPISSSKEAIRATIEGLSPQAGTPLYEAAGTAFTDIAAGYDASRINAVILLTDGRNDDAKATDDRDQRSALIAKLKSASDGEISKPVRIFTIAYGNDADTASLSTIAEASNGASYTATDPASIDKVFTAVVSNF